MAVGIQYKDGSRVPRLINNADQPFLTFVPGARKRHSKVGCVVIAATAWKLVRPGLQPSIAQPYADAGAMGTCATDRAGKSAKSERHTSTYETDMVQQNNEVGSASASDRVASSSQIQLAAA